MRDFTVSPRTHERTVATEVSATPLRDDEENNPEASASSGANPMRANIGSPDRKGETRAQNCGDDKTFTIFVKFPDEESMKVKLYEEETGSDLKEKILEKKGIPPKIQYLTFVGQPLEDGRRLVEYGVRNESTIMMRYGRTTGGGDEKDTTTKDDRDLINSLLLTIQSLTARIDSIQTQKEKDDIPTMHNKDVDKPHKYNGDKWNAWEQDFTAFLTRRDKRWKTLLNAIKDKSDKPLTEATKAKIRTEANLHKDEVYEAFQQQLYEYLKSYTTGESHATVTANGPGEAFETWRRMCDHGRSRRMRPLRDERRALYHPKQATLETLSKVIADWERRLQEYTAAVPDDAMKPQDKIMCLEDMCPEPVQRYLSEKAQNGQLGDTKHEASFKQYKDAIDTYHYEEGRWTKHSKPKLNLVGEYQGADATECINCATCKSRNNQTIVPDEPDETGTDDWTSALLGEINALVKGKIKGKAAGKGQAKGPSGGKSSPMEVDSNGPQKRQTNRPGDKNCYECGEAGHIGRECPVRQARVAAGGPPILKPEDKGKGKGKNGQGKGQWPSQTQWKSMYPGPSPTQWNSWYGYKGSGKANLFEQPQQLAALQMLFQQPGGAYSIVPKAKAARATTTRPQFQPTPTKNGFLALSRGREDDSEDQDNEQQRPSGKQDFPEQPNSATGRTAMDVNISDLIKPESRNKAKKNRGSSPDIKVADTGSTGTSSIHKLTVKKPNDDTPELKHHTNDSIIMKKLDDDTPELKPHANDSTTSRADEMPQMFVEHPMSTMDKGEAEIWQNTYKSLTETIKKGVDEGLKRLTARRGAAEKGDILDFVRHEFLSTFGDNKAMLQRANVNFLSEVKPASALCPVTGLAEPATAAAAATPGPIDTSKWEELLAIMDSGATVPVLHPQTGKSYEVHESLASRAGVEYEIANGKTIPNLGEKKMGVLTQEGTLRGYSSQCADVSKSLQSVRAMLQSGHAVCFGLGPQGTDHLIINRTSGEINRLEDDGINYLQRLWVIPPDQLAAVQERIQQQQCPKPDPEGFGRRGQ